MGAGGAEDEVGQRDRRAGVNTLGGSFSYFVVLAELTETFQGAARKRRGDGGSHTSIADMWWDMAEGLLVCSIAISF